MIVRDWDPMEFSSGAGNESGVHGWGTLGNLECRAYLLGALKPRICDNLKKLEQKILENPSS
jgi:hypothetical protein